MGILLGSKLRFANFIAQEADGIDKRSRDVEELRSRITVPVLTGFFIQFGRILHLDFNFMSSFLCAVFFHLDHGNIDADEIKL